MIKKEILFAYGTLRCPKVQKIAFGKKKKGTRDILKGYKKYKRTIEKETCPIILKKKGSFVRGKVYELSKRELKHADNYETELYLRKKVILKSGKSAWVYIGNVK